MRLICAQARLTERRFYEHFANVDEVFLAVHKQLSAQVSAEIMGKVFAGGLDGDPLQQTRDGMPAFFEFIKADPRRAPTQRVAKRPMEALEPDWSVAHRAPRPQPAVVAKPKSDPFIIALAIFVALAAGLIGAVIYVKVLR